MIKADEIVNALKRKANTDKAKILSRFFKTGRGEYGEGDIFLGITIPQIREVVKLCNTLSCVEVEKLLRSKYHEIRMTGTLYLVQKSKKATLTERKKIFDFYLTNIKAINNWDLVDLSAPTIVGEYLCLAPKEKVILKKLSAEKNIWARRIAILATFAFIRAGSYVETIKLSEIYLKDKEDLMHKATGWMLREMGKRDKRPLIIFLKKYARVMPRTMLRYAIEKLSRDERSYYLALPRKIVG